MSLKTIIAELEAAAAAEWKKIEDGAIALEQKIEAEIPTALETLTSQLGGFLMSTISNLATAEFAHLSGNEKSNLAATTIVEKAQTDGLAILAADATALVKWAFEVFKSAAPAKTP